MKTRILKLTFLLGIIALSGRVLAQDYSGAQYAKYGADPKDREKNIMAYNMFSESYKLKDYGQATKLLKDLLVAAPACSQNLYIMGASIYKNKISAAKSSEEINHLFDSLIILHDKRIENFGQDAKRGRHYIMAEKMKDYILYRPTDIKTIIEIANTAINTAGDKVDLENIPSYFNFLVEKYQDNSLEAIPLIKEYEFLTAFLEKLTIEGKDATRNSIEQLFIQSGVATCENIEKIFKPQFEANPTDKDLIKKISNLLARNKCESAFQALVAEKSYAVEPNAAAAIMLGVAFEGKGEHDKAYKYFDEAIAMESDNKVKSDYAARAAGAAILANNFRKAADYSKAAIDANDANGTAYLFLAQAYAQGASSACSEFNRQATFWLVVDLLTKARAATEADQVERINDMIRSYSSYFPKTEDMFFSDPPIQAGSAYNVNCGWISGRTTARGR